MATSARRAVWRAGDLERRRSAAADVAVHVEGHQCSADDVRRSDVVAACLGCVDLGRELYLDGKSLVVGMNSTGTTIRLRRLTPTPRAEEMPDGGPSRVGKLVEDIHP